MNKKHTRNTVINFDENILYNNKAITIWIRIFFIFNLRMSYAKYNRKSIALTLLSFKSS